jgi:hypothetical protein
MTPDAIRQTLPQVRWNLQKLWSLDLPVRQVPVDDLRWQFDLPLWQKNGMRFQVSPNQVLATPDTFPDHVRRAMTSDLQYAIHLTEHAGRLVVLDCYALPVTVRFYGEHVTWPEASSPRT